MAAAAARLRRRSFGRAKGDQMGAPQEVSQRSLSESQGNSLRAVALLGVGASVAMLAGAVQPRVAEARQLRNFVTDLFGGQGISFSDPGEGVETIALNQAALTAFDN